VVTSGGQNTFAVSVAGRGFDARIAVEQDAPLTDSACAYCTVGCTLTLHVQDNELVKVTSPRDNPVTHGTLCIKGRFGYQHVQNRD
jgi:predicted molibdopterin-dependent oxidoreductase YjgC